MATKPRIYTFHDEELAVALEAAVEGGLIAPEATPPKKLRALALYGADQIHEERERAELIAAYEGLAADEERRDAIRAWNRAAAEDGLL